MNTSLFMALLRKRYFMYIMVDIDIHINITNQSARISRDAPLISPFFPLKAVFDV